MEVQLYEIIVILIFYVNYKGRLHTEIFLNRLILVRLYLKTTCIPRKWHDTKKLKQVKIAALYYEKYEVKKKGKKTFPGFYTELDLSWNRAELRARGGLPYFIWTIINCRNPQALKKW